MQKILDSEIPMRLAAAIQLERGKTNEVLKIIILAMDRKSYLAEGYSSMFNWLVKGFGYSESAAYRRIEAAKILRDVPTMGKKLESGKINLSHLTRANKIFCNQEKLEGRKIPVNEKSRVLNALEGKTKLEADKTLSELYPATASEVKSDRLSTVNQSTTRLSVDLPDEILADLNRARDILASVFPYGRYADVIGRLAKEFLDRKDPLRKKPREQNANFEMEMKVSRELEAEQHQSQQHHPRGEEDLRHEIPLWAH